MRWFRLWVRLIFYPLLLAAVVAVLAGCWAVENLTELVVWFAGRSLPGLSLRLGKAELAGLQRIEFTDVRLLQPHRTKPLLEIGSASVEYAFPDLWRRRIAGVEVEAPRVAVDDKALADLPARRAAGKSAAWHIGRFVVRDGKCTVNLKTLPRMHCDFGADFEGLDLSPDAWRSRETQTLTVQNLRLQSQERIPKALGEIAGATVLFTLDQLAQHRVQELSVDSPVVHLQPAWLTALPVSAPTAGQAASPTLPWQVARLEVKNGELFEEGFGPGVPVASAKFAMDATDIGPGGTSERMHTAQLWDLRAAPAADPASPLGQLNAATVSFSNAGLSRGEVAKLEATGLWVGLGNRLRSFAADAARAGTPGPGHAPAAGWKPWVVRDLLIQDGYIAVSDIGLDIPHLGFHVKTELKDVALSGDERFASKELQLVELSNLSIHSPLDPFVPVLNLKTIFVGFSVAGLLRQEIEDVSILNPQLFVGEDLFWYADALKKAQSAAGPASNPTSTQGGSWVVKNVGAEFGEVVIANGGKSRATLPLSFSWRAQNLDFANLDDLQLKLKLVIPKGDYRFPSYQLDLTELSGKIEFGLPAEQHKDNLVHTLEVKEVRWKRFAAKNAFVSVTYDKHGIYGAVGASAYGGYVTGGFSFFTQADSPWTGWMSGSKVNLRGVTDALAPESIQLSGPADFTLEVNGLNHEIERLKGGYTMRRPGRLKIAKLDTLLNDLPRDWTVLKTGLTRIGLETLRDFAYDSGNGSFWFANDEGNLKLALQGPSGSRKMEAVLHGSREATAETAR